MNDPAENWDVFDLFAGDLTDDLPTVCVVHLRFVPCRAPEGCSLSSHPDAVTAVRNYQQGRA